ncbi:MAG: triose-phosphate isomerase [Methanomassiliicoccaceae archaeon]|nr:triose-phosphate isomerase [Methanomassiliicoccaceae archaeon]
MTELSKPLIVINFKVYREVEGPKALDIAKLCGSVSEDSGITIAVCPPSAELGFVSRNVSIPVFSQNADPHAPGPSTGWMTPSMIKASGAIGTLINHAEHKRSMKEMAETAELCKGCGIASIICADSVELAAQIAQFRPDMIAVEPPELIGGDISVTDADPDIVERTVNAVKEVSRSVSVLCGAGVKTGKDVKKALDLGADGVLLASGVVKAKDPRAALQDLVRYI